MVLAWVSSWTWGTGIGFAVLALLVFPDGRLPSPRWRSVVVLTAGAMLTFVVGLGFGSPTIGDTGLPNPVAVGGPVGDALNALEAAFPLVLLSALLAVVSIVVRWRRADGIERQQIKWLASAALIVGLALVLTATPLLDSTDVDNAVISTTFALLPLAMGIAVFRYRLWDIDRIISRTIGWALVTGLLLAVFGIVVLALQAAMENVTQGQTLAVAASTLVAAALFQPLRRRVQAAVDSRFDRAAYDAQRMAGAFAEDLRNEVHLPRITHELLGTIGSAVRPAAAAVWLREKGAGS
jgi:peptidoglycan/LPS O-acetylase OafA/YrhL